MFQFMNSGCYTLQTLHRTEWGEDINILFSKKQTNIFQKKKKLKMEGQTNCVLCEFRSRSTNSLKQHMENKHNVFNMTIVQVLTQQVERVDDLERKMKEKEHLGKKVEDDLNETKEALKKEKKILEEKKKAFDQLITSQKQKEEEE